MFQLLECQCELEQQNDKKETQQNVEKQSAEKIIDICHPTHPDLYYECFNVMRYLPIHEIFIDNLEEMDKHQNRGYIVVVID